MSFYALSFSLKRIPCFGVDDVDHRRRLVHTAIDPLDGHIGVLVRILVVQVVVELEKLIYIKDFTSVAEAVHLTKNTNMKHAIEVVVQILANHIAQDVTADLDILDVAARMVSMLDFAHY